MPAIPEPIKTPTVDDARQSEEDLLRLRRRRGRASTFLTGQQRSAKASSQLLGASNGAPNLGGTATDAGGGMSRITKGTPSV